MNPGIYDGIPDEKYHADWRHVLGMYQCKDPRCGCLRYGPKEDRK